MAKQWMAPFAFLYGAVVTVRNKMFDWGLLKTHRYDIPIVCVGNITVGGTGKTPVTELLVSHLSKQWNIAVLSRGYKRRTNGYLEVTAGTPFLDSGDESKQIKLKFPGIVVSVCEDRNAGILRIREEHPEINLIILDDGFQHRRVEPWVSIVLMDYTRPIYRDSLLPVGNLRDTKAQMHRANYVIVTKCPPDMSALDRRIVQKSLGLFPYQDLYFSGVQQCQPQPVFPQDAVEPLAEGAHVVAMSGIGNPEAFNRMVSAKFRMAGQLVFPDHHPYRRRDIDTMLKALEGAPAGTVIVTTEKDRVKLSNGKKIPEYIRQRLYYIPIKISLTEDSLSDFLSKLDYDVRTDPKDRLLRS